MESDTDLDDISLASTEVSDHDADTEYEVDKILATKIVDGRELYLVQWKNYPIERSTWEPITSFTDTSTVEQWHQTAARQQRAQEPPFDWRAWDKQREIDEIKAYERRRKREKKRAKLRQERRERRKERERQRRTRPRDDSPTLDGFIIDDDASDDDSLDDDSPSEKGRRNDSEGETSEDSLMKEAFVRSQVRGGEPRRRRRRPLPSDEDDSPLTSPKTKFTRAPKHVKRRRASSPGEGLAGAAQDLSINPKKKRRRKTVDLARTNTNSAPSKPGPFRTDKRRTSGGNITGQPQTFHTLSYLNRVQKASQNEPPPDMSKIELFAPSLQPRGLNVPRKTSLQSPTTLNPPRRIPSPETDPNTSKQASDGHLSPMKTNINSIYGAFRIPKRKPTAPTPGAAPSLGHLQQEGEDLHTDNKKDPEPAGDASKDPMPTDKMDVDDIHNRAQSTIIPPYQHMEVDAYRPTGPRVFQCELELGPTAAHVGLANFVGFTSSYVDELEKKDNVQSLWISKFYGQDYIKDFFAPHYGSPSHVAAVEIDLNQVQPLVNALNFLKGAGVILHEDFTMLVFLPSNSDLRGAFKLPQLQPTPAKVKPALRVVAYPRLEGITIPKVNSPKEDQVHEQSTPAYLPPWEQDLRLSLPAYMSLTMGVEWDEILEVGKSKSAAAFILYYPQLAEAEGREYRDALETMGRTIVEKSEIPDWIMTKPRRTTVLIHQSLRRQLHLLPQLELLRRKTDFNFWFFGMKIEHGMIVEKPQRIFVMGTLLFLTPQFILESPAAFRTCKNFRDNKKVSTMMMLPSTWEQRLEEKLRLDPSEELLMTIFSIKRAIDDGEIEILPVQLHLGIDEFETYLDEFVFYQLNNPTEYRRWCVGQATPRGRSRPPERLYHNIEIFNPEQAIKEFPFPNPNSSHSRK